jgi:hypothetical protein
MNVVVRAGETLLMLAARFGHLALVRDLLARRGDVAKSTAMGWTALHYAAICFNPRSQVQLGAADAARPCRWGAELSGARRAGGGVPRWARPRALQAWGVLQGCAVEDAR